MQNQQTHELEIITQSPTVESLGIKKEESQTSDMNLIVLDGISMSKDEVVAKLNEELRQKALCFGETSADASAVLMRLIEYSPYRIEMCFTREDIRKPSAPFSFKIFNPYSSQ